MGGMPGNTKVRPTCKDASRIVLGDFCPSCSICVNSHRMGPGLSTEPCMSGREKRDGWRKVASTDDVTLTRRLRRSAVAAHADSTRGCRTCGKREPGRGLVAGKRMLGFFSLSFQTLEVCADFFGWGKASPKSINHLCRC